LSMAQKQIAPTTTIIKTPIKTEIMATSLCCRTSFRLRPRLIKTSLTKLRRPLGEPLPALGLLFGRRGGIDNPFDRFGGELPSAQPPAALAGGPRWRLDLEPDLDQPADGLRKRQGGRAAYPNPRRVGKFRSAGKITGPRRRTASPKFSDRARPMKRRRRSIRKRNRQRLVSHARRLRR
jgi:hypothetical protein